MSDGVHNAAGKGIPNLWMQASQGVLFKPGSPNPALRARHSSPEKGLLLYLCAVQPSFLISCN